MNSQDASSWVFSFLSEKFFSSCIVHGYFKKNEKNIFCLNCFISICPHCVPLHKSHHLLQVRRYVLHDVVRLNDLSNLFDCQHVQPYTTNHAQVIFLKQRPQRRPFHGSTISCHTCDRPLREPFHFCSFACKVQYLVAYEGSISRYLYDCEALPLSVDTDIDDMVDIVDPRMTPNSVLDDALMTANLFSRTSSSSSGNGDSEYLTVGCTASSFDIPRKKRTTRVPVSSNNYCSAPDTIAVHRRKGIPVRSPLF